MTPLPSCSNISLHSFPALYAFAGVFTGICADAPASPRGSLSIAIVQQGGLAEFLINPILYSQIKQTFKFKTIEFQRK